MTPDSHGPHVPLPALLITKKKILAAAIGVALNHGAYVTQVAESGAEGLKVARGGPLAVVLWDMEADGMLEIFVAALRRRNKTVGIIALSRETTLAERLKAFDQGAADVLLLPFQPEELLARVLAVTRRFSRVSRALVPVQRLGDLDVNILEPPVQAGGDELRLTPLELSLLYLLAANAERALGRQDILEYLWRTDYNADSNVVDRHIHNLRIKLQNSWKRPRYIVTERGVGYRFMRLAVAPRAPKALPATAQGREGLSG